MLSTSLIDQIQHDYPDLLLTPAERFEWRPDSHTIAYDPEDPALEARLLHELGHATLEHRTYNRDIELIAMERDAWELALNTLGPRYSLTVHRDAFHYDMDTYRDWLHSRSTCPHCSSNGLQTKSNVYVCVTCQESWRVNEARSCQLRRWKH